MCFAERGTVEVTVVEEQSKKNSDEVTVEEEQSKKKSDDLHKNSLSWNNPLFHYRVFISSLSENIGKAHFH
jgi:hypothetical protein